MKLIDEKGRLFGLINLIDLVVLLAVILAAAGIGWKVLSSTQQAQAPRNAATITYTARVRNVPVDMANAYAAYQDQLPLNLVSGTAYLSYATLDSITLVPTQMTTTDETGMPFLASDPNVMDVIFTCTAEAEPDQAVWSVGAQEIRVGRGHTVKTRWFEASSVVESVVVK